LIKQAKDRQDPGQYVNPMGGHVSSGETDEEALKREVLEELGLEGFEHKLVGKAIYDRDILGHRENHYFIVYDIFSDGNIILSEEADEYRWFEENELKHEIKEKPHAFGPSYFFVLENFYPDLLR
jgi:8-oxo-dGTP pyrophosphatase MutT (NUDIX family)